MNDDALSHAHVATPEPVSVNIFEILSQAAAAVSSLTVVSAVFYNWAYFSTVAPRVGQLLTISDQVSSALQWLPASIISYCVGLILNFGVMGRILGGRPLRHYGPRTIVHITVAISITLAYFTSGPSNWDGVIATSFMWVFYMLTVTMNQAWLTQLRIFLIIAAMLMFISLSRGNANGLADLGSKTSDATLVTKEGPQIAPALVLREIEKGVLLRTIKDNKITFVPWEDVRELIVSPSQINRHTRMCIYFNMFCSLTDPTG